MAQTTGSEMSVAVQQANRRSDYVVFWMNVILSCIISGIALVVGYYIAHSEDPATVDEYGLSPVESFFVQNATFIFIGLVILVITLVMIRMMRQMYLGNALQVEYSDFAWLRTWSNQVAKDLAMPPVEIMITQDPVMNAFAFGFMKPYTIVLNSGTVRYATKEQLKAIVVHEMAHIKYKHTAMGTYSGILRMIPGLGMLFGWMLDFWSRRAEFTADRLALTYLRDKEQVKQALICVHVGPDVAPAFNELAQQWQVYKTDSSFNAFTQSFSSHPFLVRRLQRIEATYAELAPLWQEEEAQAAETMKRSRDNDKDSSDGTIA